MLPVILWCQVGELISNIIRKLLLLLKNKIVQIMISGHECKNNLDGITVYYNSIRL